MQEQWFTVDEIATQLRVNRETVRRWLRSGRLRGILLADKAGWRVAASELERFLGPGLGNLAA